MTEESNRQAERTAAIDEAARLLQADQRLQILTGGLSHDEWLARQKRLAAQEKQYQAEQDARDASRMAAREALATYGTNREVALAAVRIDHELATCLDPIRQRELDRERSCLIQAWPALVEMELVRLQARPGVVAYPTEGES